MDEYKDLLNKIEVCYKKKNKINIKSKDIKSILNLISKICKYVINNLSSLTDIKENEKISKIREGIMLFNSTFYLLSEKKIIYTINLLFPIWYRFKNDIIEKKSFDFIKNKRVQMLLHSTYTDLINNVCNKIPYISLDKFQNVINEFILNNYFDFIIKKLENINL